MSFHYNLLMYFHFMLQNLILLAQVTYLFPNGVVGIQIYGCDCECPIKSVTCSLSSKLRDNLIGLLAIFFLILVANNLSRYFSLPASKNFYVFSPSIPNT